MSSLAEKLNISKDEVESTAKRFNYMLQLRKQTTINPVHLETVTEEWKVLARRLKKGGDLLEQSQDKDTPHYQMLSNLYLFLVGVIAFYDRFFQDILPHQEYWPIKESVATILKFGDEG